MSKDSKEREFQAQLERDNKRVVDELLNDGQCSDLRDFYKNHFDEIEANLDGQNVRQVIEDFWKIEPSLKSVIDDNFLFVTQVNKAMKDGFLSKDMFK